MLKRYITIILAILILVGCAPEKKPKEEPLFLYSESSLYGYINRSGEIIIEPQFAYATQFSEGLAFVETTEGITGYIDIGGDFAFTLITTADIPIFMGLVGDRFQDGVAVIMDSKYYLINRQGEKISDDYGALHGLRENYCAYSNQTRSMYTGHKEVYSFLNSQGEPATEQEFAFADNFSNGYAAVAILNYAGTEMFNPDKDRLWGVINGEFELVIDYQYDNMGLYTEGLIPVRKDGKWGYINLKNETVIPFIFDDAIDSNSTGYTFWWPNLSRFSYGWDFYDPYRQPQQFGHHFSDGLASVYKDGKWGYINPRGEVIIPFDYDAVRPFSDGLAAVSRNGKWGFINTSGEIIIPMKYVKVLNCVNGLIAVGDKNTEFVYYIDKEGNIVTPKPKAGG